MRIGKKNLKVAIARCFAFVGPWLPRNQHFAIGNFIEDGLLGLPINVKATSQVYRSYMHADDLVIWLMTICDHANFSCPIYNVGSDQAVEVGALAKIIADKFSVKVNRSSLVSKSIDQYIPSIEKARDELGLYLTINLNSAIDKTIDSIHLKKFVC